MCLTALLIYGFLSGTDTRQIERDRAWLNEHAAVAKDGGCWRGGEGSYHLALFPVGRADRMFLVSYVVAGAFWKPSEPRKVLRSAHDWMKATCWTLVDGKPRKVWQESLKPTTAGCPRGTLGWIAYTGIGQHDLCSKPKPFALDVKTCSRAALLDFKGRQDLVCTQFANSDSETMVGYSIRSGGKVSEAEEMEPYYQGGPKVYSMPMTAAEIRLLGMRKKRQ